MSLSNAIAIVRRMDARILVKVPAGFGRSAYSYWREGGEEKNVGKEKEVQRQKAEKNLAFVDERIKEEEKLLRTAGVDVDGANRALKNILDKAEIRIRIPDEDALNAVSDYRFKNASEFDPKVLNEKFNIKSLGVDDYIPYRVKKEGELFGKTPPEDRPIYGYLKLPHEEEDPSGTVEAYGDIIVAIKDSSRNRASFTMADSLSGHEFIPSRLSNPSIVSFVPQKYRNAFKEGNPQIVSAMKTHAEQIKKGDSEWLRALTAHIGGGEGGYMEVQIHGQVKPSDINYITSQYYEISQTTKNNLKMNGVKHIDSTSEDITNAPISDFVIKKGEKPDPQKTALAQNMIALSLQGQEYKKRLNKRGLSTVPLTNAIATIRRQDAQVKVNVPATANRKAYSYMREGSDTPSPTVVVTKRKTFPVKRTLLGVGAAVVAGGALTAGVLAMRRAKKGGEDFVEPKGLISGDDAIDAESREVSNAVKGSSSKGLISSGQPSQRKKPLVTPPPSKPERVLVTPPPKPISQMVKEGANTRSLSKQNAVLIDKGESSVSRSGVISKKNTRLVTEEPTTTNISEKKKGVLSKGIEAIKKMTQEGVERDRKAGGAFAEREIDLNKTAYSAGEKSRIAAQNLATFAKAYNETFGKKQPKAIDVEATEVKEALPEGKSMKKAPKPKKAKQKPPTAAEIKATQKKLNDLNKGS